MRIHFKRWIEWKNFVKSRQDGEYKMFVNVTAPDLTVKKELLERHWTFIAQHKRSFFSPIRSIKHNFKILKRQNICFRCTREIWL